MILIRFEFRGEGVSMRSDDEGNIDGNFESDIMRREQVTLFSLFGKLSLDEVTHPCLEVDISEEGEED